VLGHIDAHMSGAISVTDLAKTVRLSAGHFSRSCKRTFGEPPTALIISRRLERAKVLMVETKEPLNQIALQCGFSDQAHFANRFRRCTGTTPLAWRRENLRPDEVSLGL
jgi:AraC family transcriptional regulator